LISKEQCSFKLGIKRHHKLSCYCTINPQA